MLQSRGLLDRCKLLAADFFGALPMRADICLLMRVLHDWNDADAVRILRRAGQARRLREAGVNAAKARGWQVLVTDHHLPGDGLPDADCIVNPNQPGCTFPSKALAGVGVMFYVILATRAELRRRDHFAGTAGGALGRAVGGSWWPSIIVGFLPARARCLRGGTSRRRHRRCRT